MNTFENLGDNADNILKYMAAEDELLFKEQTRFNPFDDVRMRVSAFVEGNPKRVFTLDDLKKSLQQDIIFTRTLIEQTLESLTQQGLVQQLTKKYKTKRYKSTAPPLTVTNGQDNDDNQPQDIMAKQARADYYLQIEKARQHKRKNRVIYKA